MLKTTTAALLLATLTVPGLGPAITPAWAQALAPGAHTGAAVQAPATHDTAGKPTADGYNTPSARNPVMTDNGAMRSSKIVGSSVYNDKDEKLGSVDDLVISPDKSVHAVLSVGGVLGMGTKMVEVPFDRLKFGNTKSSSDNRVVLPNTTVDALKSMPDYHYADHS